MSRLEVVHRQLGHLVLDRQDGLDGTTAAALFSANRAYRYALTREWDSTKPPAVFVMLNPSTADAFVTDPTITRCRNFARDWGCGGLVVVNAFGLRSTDPKALRTHSEPVGPSNDQVIAAVLLAGNTGPIVAAWGADPMVGRTGRDRRVIDLVHAIGDQVLCLGVTAKGAPRHPLYLRADSRPEPYPSPEAYAIAANRAMS